MFTDVIFSGLCHDNQGRSRWRKTFAVSGFACILRGQYVKTSLRTDTERSTKKQTLNADPAMLNRVRSISDRLIAQVGVFRTDAEQWQWEVNVEKMIN